MAADKVIDATNWKHFSVVTADGVHLHLHALYDVPDSWQLTNGITHDHFEYMHLLPQPRLRS